MKIKKDDLVEVIAGDDRGQRGKVLKVDPKKRQVVVQGINKAYRHVRPSQRNPQGGRLQIEQPLDISNVMLVDPKTNRPTRVRVQIDSDGSKKLVAVNGGNVINTIRHAK
ncbi:MAG: 50S ribosomal protein L24 [Sedimentisphaerales bacterium]|nr:50S ribosomal protein L24 [Sedimentisphaerales bacterium]